MALVAHRCPYPVVVVMDIPMVIVVVNDQGARRTLSWHDGDGRHEHDDGRLMTMVMFMFVMMLMIVLHGRRSAPDRIRIRYTYQLTSMSVMRRPSPCATRNLYPPHSGRPARAR